MTRLLLLSGVLAALSLSSACRDAPVLESSASGPAGSIGGGSSDGGAVGAGGEAGATTGGGGSALAPIYLGVVSNSPAGGRSSMLSELRAFAAGVRLVALDVDFEAIDATALAARLSGYGEQQLRVVVTLLVVDGAQAQRPLGLELSAWNDAAIKQALVDALYTIDAADAGSVVAISIGRRLDDYLAAEPDEAAALSELVSHGIEAGPSDIPLGAGITLAGSGDPLVAPLAAAGEVAIFSYLPGLGDAFSRPSAVAKDLDAMASLAADRPVLLLETGFSSGSAIGASEETQTQGLDAFFTALEPRRPRFPWVIIHQLHDLGPEGCEMLADEQLEDPAGVWADYACHTGLRDATDQPKPSWSRFLQATARFASP